MIFSGRLNEDGWNTCVIRCLLDLLKFPLTFT
jgi:hypothetical protein